MQVSQKAISYAQVSREVATDHHRHRPAICLHPQRERIDARGRANVDEDHIEKGERVDVPASKDTLQDRPAQLLSRGSARFGHAFLRKEFIVGGEEK